LKGSPDSALSQLEAVLAASSKVRLAVLFGSRATGKARDSSDFDVGILPAGSLTLQAELELAAALSAAVGGEVDLVRLDAADPLVGREVAQNGVCLLESAPGEFAAFRATAMSHWADFEETIAPHRSRFLRRLASR
jgi:predicted nucleotidyltransferase